MLTYDPFLSFEHSECLLLGVYTAAKFAEGTETAWEANVPPFLYHGTISEDDWRLVPSTETDHYVILLIRR